MAWDLGGLKERPIADESPAACLSGFAVGIAPHGVRTCALRRPRATAFIRPYYNLTRAIRHMSPCLNRKM